MFYIGTAGWVIPQRYQRDVAASGTHLERYATRLNAAEINSSFHRHHRPDTYRRWADAVPETFRFSAKIPRTITHEHGLQDCEDDLARFLGEAGCLGKKLAVLLVQLPPRLEFEPRVARRFFRELGSRAAARLACEPRHPSWSSPRAQELLATCSVARVAADPASWPSGDEPGGDAALVYYRLHGAPRVYYSDYDPASLREWARRMKRPSARADSTWCIFDNTVMGCAFGNALTLAGYSLATA